MVRFDIPAPAADGSIAVSPDGRMLAYSSRGPNGENLLWIHAFDSTEDRKLAGTEDAAYPFWSPDSRYLGFFAQGKLKKVDTAGGLAQSLCDAPHGRGGTWNASGEIVFAPGASGPLLRVSAAGGATRLAASQQSAPGAKAQRWPHFLPDGRHFLYWDDARQPQTSGLFVGALESSEAKLLLPGVSSAVFSNDHLLFVRGGTLLAQPFDPLRLELTSEARPISEDTGWSADRGPAFSASANGILASSKAAGRRTQLAWFDREGKMIGQVGEPGIVESFALSPDGARAVVARRESEDGPSALWLLEFARNVSMRLTFGPLKDSSPVWSPDGSRILFSAHRDEGGAVYQLLANGAGKEELLLQTPAAANADSSSPDGRFLAYTTTDPKGGSSIWALPLQRGEQKPMPILQDNFRIRQGTFAPDDRWIAYVSNESGRDEVYVSSFPAGQGKWLISSNGGSWPFWRCDGRELFYISPEGMLTSVGVSASASGIKPGIPVALFHTDGTSAYAAAADGQRFLLRAPAEDRAPPQIHVVMNWPQLLGKP